MKIIEPPFICVYRESPSRLSIQHMVFARLRTHESGTCIEGYNFKKFKPLRLQPSRVIKTFDTVTEAKEYRKSISGQDIPSLPVEEITLPEKKENQSNVGFEICFTGFDATKSNDLISKADEVGLVVRGKVTKKLTALCVGLNAGPAKFEQALELDILILTEDEFNLFLKSGVLPPPPSLDEY